MRKTDTHLVNFYIKLVSLQVVCIGCKVLKQGFLTQCLWRYLKIMFPLNWIMISIYRIEHINKLEPFHTVFLSFNYRQHKLNIYFINRN